MIRKLWGWLMRPVKEPPATKLDHDVKDKSNLDALLGAFAGAINRHADAIASPETSLVDALNGIGAGLQAVALALSTPHDNSEEVKQQIERLKSSRSSLAESIKQHNEGEK